LDVVATPHSHNFRSFIRVAPWLVKVQKEMVTVVTNPFHTTQLWGFWCAEIAALL
jgi:hypothetical protein